MVEAFAGNKQLRKILRLFIRKSPFVVFRLPFRLLLFATFSFSHNWVAFCIKDRLLGNDWCYLVELYELLVVFLDDFRLVSEL